MIRGGPNNYQTRTKAIWLPKVPVGVFRQGLTRHLCRAEPPEDHLHGPLFPDLERSPGNRGKFS
jgi:hypothetical protein